MSRLVAAVGLGILLGGCAATGRSGPDVEAFVKMRWPVNADLGPLPERTLYFVYNPDGINQLYRVPRDTSQDQAVKITNFKDGISGYRLSDDGRWIVVSAAAGGSGRAVYAWDLAGGAAGGLLTAGFAAPLLGIKGALLVAGAAAAAALAGGLYAFYLRPSSSKESTVKE